MFPLIFLFLGYVVIALVILFGFNSDPTWYGYYLLIGLPITIAFAIPLRFSGPVKVVKLFNITYFDNREDGGDFEIQYSDARNQKGDKAKKMIVKSIMNNPKHRIEAYTRPRLPEDFPMDTKIGWTLDVISKRGSRNLRLAFRL